ncbi:hypothetical protein AQUCO_11000034v1 [Aquilegia coerulea]|uniref:DUF4408 domain-containing protein n=1 Tax=Aquilegia coerulea TaxID=218851 RepID=A0A2G5C473_AQUCA|nr:hypothetical protein AQUCO_11000034v1 [Aquilegia coerulea]
MRDMKSQKSFKLLLSVSILFFSYYSSSVSYYFHSPVSTIFRFYLQYHNIFDRSYMFLVCNGILVILGLVGSSSSFNDSSSTTTAGEVSNINGVYSMNYVAEKQPDVQSVEEEDGEVVGNKSVIVESAKEEHNDFSIRDEEQVVVEEEEEEDNEKFDYFTDEVEEGNKLSTEELNKKFDDFIRRMKEEIRIEAQQHLIMVQ